jgi:hypothetical protein
MMNLLEGQPIPMTNKKATVLRVALRSMVGETGFEPATLWSQTTKPYI